MVELDWLDSTRRIDDLVSLFCREAGTEYISHSEIMVGRALSPDRWSPELPRILRAEFEARAVGAPRPEATRRGATSHTLCATEGRRLVAFANCAFDGSRGAPHMVLEDVIVASDKHGRGLFAEMFGHLRKTAEELGIELVLLESGVRNDAAHVIFEHYGFEVISKTFMLRL